MEKNNKKRLFILNIPKVGDVWVSKEFLTEYVKMRRREWKNDKNEGRCLIFSEKTGQFIRCRGNCSECLQPKQGHPLSYEYLLEEGIEPCDENNEIIAYVERNEVKEKVMWAFDHLEKLDSQIMKLYFYEDLSPAEIGKRLGIGKSTVQRHLSSSIAAVKSFLLKVYGTKEAVLVALA